MTTLFQIRRPDLGRAYDKRLNKAYIDARPELKSFIPFDPAVDFDFVDEINAGFQRVTALAVAANTVTYETDAERMADASQPDGRVGHTLSSGTYHRWQAGMWVLLDVAGGTDARLPDASAAPDGKVVVTAGGAYVLTDAPSGTDARLPDPSAAPDGQVVVTNAGAYTLGDPPSGGGSLTVKNTASTFSTVANTLVLKNFALTALGNGAVELALDQAVTRSYGPSNPVPLDDVPAVFEQHGPGPGQCPNYTPNESNGYLPYAYFDVLSAASADRFGLLVFEQNSAEYVHTLTLTRIRKANGAAAEDVIFVHTAEPYAPSQNEQRWVEYILPAPHDFLIGERYLLSLSTDTPFQQIPADPASAANRDFGPFRKLSNVEIEGVRATYPVRIGTSDIAKGVYGTLGFEHMARGSEIEALLDSTLALGFDADGPTRLGPVALWLRASDLDALANGANVTAWADASGKTSGLVQASAPSQPTLQKGVANGRSAVRFAGAQWMSLATLPTYASAAVTVVVVLANVGTNSAVILESSTNANVNAGSFAMYVEPVRYVVACANINSGGSVNLAQSVATLPASAAGYALAALDYTLGAEAANIAVNTSSAQTRQFNAANTALTFADRPLYLGGRGGSGGFIGDVLEVLVFLGRLSPAVHAELVHGYLKPRYGLVF